MERFRARHKQPENDYNVDLDEAVKPENLTGDGEVRAKASGAIAAELVRYAGLDENSALARYATTGRGSNEELREEYLLIHHDPSAPEPIRELVAWFASGVIAAENTYGRFPHRPHGQTPSLRSILWETSTGEGEEAIAVNVPADTPTEIIRRLRDRLTPLLDELGAPFEAFLKLPDVNATADNLQKTFQDFYIGSFDDREALVRELTEYNQWEEEITRLCQQHGIPEGVVTIDLDELWHYVEGGWDIIPGNDGRLHVFMT